MPEIPDLEAIRGFLNQRITGVEIAEAETLIPYVVRTGAADFVATMTGNRFGTILRRGKFLLRRPFRTRNVVRPNYLEPV